MGRNKRTKEKKMKIRRAVERDLLTSGLYNKRVEADRTKYNRKKKHKKGDLID